MPISSSATLILRPFGVFQVWSSIVIGVQPSCRSDARITAIGPGFKTRTEQDLYLRPNALEISDVLLDLTEPRHPFERGAMPLGYGRCALDVAGVSDPGMGSVAFKQERLTRTSETQAADQNGEKAPCRSGHRLSHKKITRATLPITEVTVDRPSSSGR